MHRILQQIHRIMTMSQPPNRILVFTLNPSDVPALTSEIETSLSTLTTLPSEILIHPIEDSTVLLKSMAAGGLRTYEVVYDNNVFVYITPEEFLRTHYQWFEKQVSRLYSQEHELVELCADYSPEDAFQDCSMELPKILSKFDPSNQNKPDNCQNLRVHVANRLRRYWSRVVEKKLESILVELNKQVSLLEGQ